MVNSAYLNPLYSYPNWFSSQANDFFSFYRLQSEISCPEKKISGLKQKKERVCRYCHQKWPLVTFDKEAHLLSNLLGNRTLLSNFECDTCNHTFGKYESDLANYLGITRTVLSAKGKEKVPKFKSHDSNLTVESLEDSTEGTVVNFKRFDGLDQTFEFDKEKAQTIIKYTKNPYKPLNVYKAILKMALSCLSEEEVMDYPFAFKYLTSNKYDANYMGFQKISIYTTPLNMTLEKPVGMIFKKFNEKELRFTHVFSLTTLNMVFQIIIPFNRKDAWFFNPGNSIETVWCPPIFGSEYPFPPESIIAETLNFDTTDTIKGIQQKFIIPGHKSEFEKRRFTDKETGETYEEDFDGNQIIGINLLKVSDDDNNK